MLSLQVMGIHTVHHTNNGCGLIGVTVGIALWFLKPFRDS